MAARILVVEDNQANITLFQYVLVAGGYTVLLATSGEEGLSLAVEHRPDLVLLDLRLPEMDGYQVAATLRTHPELSATRIVALTASAMLGDRERIAAAGFDGYIQKPIEPATFIVQVQRCLATMRPHSASGGARSA